MTVAERNFQRTVYAHYKKHGRHALPWRKNRTAYRVIVSELMLQQTQVDRVVPKFNAFLELFPTVDALARAPLSKVLQAWSGLGYNRRAKFLHALAREAVSRYKGKFPRAVAELESLPGIGPYTARAVAVFAFDTPVALIETNVRTVYIHHFFNDAPSVADGELLPLIERTLDRSAPSQWYAALMDYGAYLKKSGNVSHRKSSAYKKQPSFKGSRRQIRGAIIRSLLAEPHTAMALAKAHKLQGDTIHSVLSDLETEKMIVRQGRKYALAGA